MSQATYNDMRAKFLTTELENKQLKEHLRGLNERFTQVSNEKLELENRFETFSVS